uniref:Coat protein n=1 Tax=Prunevirus armeniacae TaxID=1343920 RepID=A0A0H3YC08_9VIRU|nr:coat protein [Apricot vein clearing associated virus]QEU48924.1 coat protein [Apricot vein clearing associated virus]QIH53563.1 coat protein [Apricot vein clearing associated virus]BCA25723.1 coat protein [Apricot vein clearing associated virus]
MSLKNQKRDAFFRDICTMTWDQFIDPTDQWALKTTVEGAARNLTADHLRRKAAILNHHLKLIAGNVAEIGANENYQWPNEDIPVPAYSPPQEQVNCAVPINLRDWVNALMLLIRNHQNRNWRQTTMREAMKSLADQALDYFLEDPTRVGHLAEKMPDFADTAREVMFDFATGLSQRHIIGPIHKNRRMAIQNAQSRLFKTEGTKMFFEARGTVDRVASYEL